MTREIVICSISDDEMMRMSGPVPLSVHIRNRLNEQGFKFRDDGNSSLIINENPEPIGRLVKWYDIEKRTTFFKQWLHT